MIGHGISKHLWGKLRNNFSKFRGWYFKRRRFCTQLQLRFSNLFRVLVSQLQHERATARKCCRDFIIIVDAKKLIVEVKGIVKCVLQMFNFLISLILGLLKSGLIIETSAIISVELHSYTS